VIVIHANKGLNDYTRNVARRLAKQGYGALAIDFSRAMAVLRRPTLKAKGSAIFASSLFGRKSQKIPTRAIPISKLCRISAATASV